MEDFRNLEFSTISTEDLLGRPLNDIERKNAPKNNLFVKGTLEIPLEGPRVSVIGTRKPSDEGIQNTVNISKTLVDNQAIVVSGLAAGVDATAHKTAIKNEGKTIAVLGTPLNHVYPKANFQLQKEIMENHLAVSQFSIGYPITRKNFVIRNRTMALISDATVIVEAGESSGTLHQGWETIRLGRPLFILSSVITNPQLKWPKEMLDYGAIELSDTNDIFEFLPSKLMTPDIFS